MRVQGPGFPDLECIEVEIQKLKPNYGESKATGHWKGQGSPAAYLQGLTIKPLVKWLKVKRSEHHKPTLNQELHEHVGTRPPSLHPSVSPLF